MNTLQILISGDYWHEDFRQPFSKLEVPATMVPADRVASLTSQDYQLIVLAQSRRDQIAQSTVDSLRAQMPGVPIVVLLGSWCEGENRSGNSLLGVTQVMWHQWESRFERFFSKVKDGLKSDWHLPLTASVSDRVRDFSPDPAIAASIHGKKVLVSSEDRTTFESITDMLGVYQCASSWDQSFESKFEDVDAICVDGNSTSNELIDRVRELKSRFEAAPITVMLNFPRQQDMDALMAAGVQEVVSKPYTHNEFLHSLIRAMGGNVAATPESQRQTIPRPSILGKRLARKP